MQSHDSSSDDSHRDWKQDRLEFQCRLTAGEAPEQESHYRNFSRTSKSHKGAVKSTGTDSPGTKKSTSESIHSEWMGPAWSGSLKEKSRALFQHEQRAASDEESPALFNGWGSEPAPKPGKAQPAKLMAPPGRRPSPEEKIVDGLGAWCDDQAADDVSDVTTAMNGGTGGAASAGNPSAGWDAVPPAEGLPFVSVYFCSGVLCRTHRPLEDCL